MLVRMLVRRRCTSERLLTKQAESSVLSARSRESGTRMLSRQPSQNLLLK